MKIALFISIGFVFLFSCKKEELVLIKKVEEKIDYQFGYVVNGGSNTISIINIEKQILIDSILLAKPVSQFYAHHISISPDKNILAVAIPQANFIDHTALHSLQTSSNKGGILIIDRLKKQVILEIDVPNINFDVLFSPDGTEIWTVSSIEKSEIFVYDSKTFALKKRFFVGANPSGMVFSKNGKYAFLALTHSSYVQVVDIAKKEIIKNIKVDNSPTNVWTGEKYIYIENTDLKLINIVDSETLEGVQTINLDFNPGEIVENKALNQFWVCHTNENAMSVFENKDLKFNRINTIKLNFLPHSITFNEDKMALVVSSISNKISFIDTKSLLIKDLQIGKSPNCLLIVNP
jgi:DNA-binding beta-propeller fold protein YncE